MRTLRVIGIGTGNPEHLTLQAVRALADVDAVFALDKGAEKADLLALRRAICAEHIRKPYRFVAAEDPARDRRPADYGGTVEAWHAARAELLEGLIRDNLGAGEVGAFLVWGDPSLYDSTLRILERIRARSTLPFACTVVPGITSVQALTAAHQILLNRIGAEVLITTGRNLADGVLVADSTVVMLDGDPAFDHLDPELTIYWGAYLGSPDEILLSGRLGTVGPEIRRLRAEARTRHGWIMDTYLLRRP
ncbi:precorrin-6A synthase (deacetylating) [Methylobacterium radiodurans]|uniref:Precorrin-6A synthase [deacetylating] n=1 Tax=Methylobacterium radiodurans TaxID=2202828 RepID=A0A2U8VVC6_9HYPH|nr:precorrin-6A synthase (deacetylating) [Methylobacterium radiodurans]AWN37328.1 precorrin-6A synthase (deacetylating) [Methylobacterium radiodurans]